MCFAESIGESPRPRCAASTGVASSVEAQGPPGDPCASHFHSIRKSARSGAADLADYGGSGMDGKILLVDEWRAVRLLGRRVLTSLGFQTREARTGREALEILNTESDIAAVLLEWKPEDEDCLDVAKRLAGVPGQSKPPVIACGDIFERSQIIAALEAGADEFLQKPYSRETIREKFAQLGISKLDDSPPVEVVSRNR
jgi:two-component system, chemotaxis family, chemotaxis protein CheY